MTIRYFNTGLELRGVDVGQEFLIQDGWLEITSMPETSDYRGAWVLNGSVITEDATAKAELIAAKAKADLKQSGVLFEGVLCSAQAEDMWGLNAVEGFVRAGNATPFKFENGNTIVLTQDNIDAFQAVWVPFRASFFA